MGKGEKEFTRNFVGKIEVIAEFHDPNAEEPS
jgi:hypothetical protein